MAYLAIARKYRPATFDEIVGQEHVTRTLKNALSSGRIHHAFLFCGARGVGKTTAARALARSLNCVQGPTSTPCGECPSCRDIAHGSSPDLIEIDGASNNSVEDIRDLRETVHYAPTQGKRKIYLIDEVHMLSKAAFNALLKTLEEPPPHVIFIFATTEPNKILDTILSRVQRFDFKRIAVPSVVERLRDIATNEGSELSDNGLRMIARAGEGSMRDAQSHLDKVLSAGGTGRIADEMVAETLGLIDRGLLYAMLEGLLNGNADGCLAAIDQVYSYGFELSQFTSELLELLRHATLVKLSPSSKRFVDLSEDELERLDALMAEVDPEQSTRLFHALLETHDQVSRANRPRIVLEMSVARLCTVRKVQPLATLLGRLEDLERRLRHQGKAQGVAAPRRPRNTVADAKPVRDNQPAPEPQRNKLRPQPPQQGTARSKRQPPAAPQPPADLPPSPPVFEPPPSYLESSEPPPRQPRAPQDPWPTIQAALERLGPPGDSLVSARLERIGNTMTLQFPAGPKLVRARRGLQDPAVEALLRKQYPRIRHFEVLPLSGTGTKNDRKQALSRKVMADPEARRIIEALGATITEVIPLNEGDRDE